MTLGYYYYDEIFPDSELEEGDEWSGFDICLALCNDACNEYQNSYSDKENLITTGLDTFTKYGNQYVQNKVMNNISCCLILGGGGEVLNCDQIPLICAVAWTTNGCEICTCQRLAIDTTNDPVVQYIAHGNRDYDIKIQPVMPIQPWHIILCGMPMYYSANNLEIEEEPAALQMYALRSSWSEEVVRCYYSGYKVCDYVIDQQGIIYTPGTYYVNYTAQRIQFGPVSLDSFKVNLEDPCGYEGLLLVYTTYNQMYHIPITKVKGISSTATTVAGTTNDRLRMKSIYSSAYPREYDYQYLGLDNKFITTSDKMTYTLSTYVFDNKTAEDQMKYGWPFVVKAWFYDFRTGERFEVKITKLADWSKFKGLNSFDVQVQRI